MFCFNFRIFVPYVQQKGAENIALVLDSLTAHMVVDVQERIRNLGVKLFFIPGGLTGLVQPIDVGIVSPFKHWIKEGWSSLPNKAREHPMFKRRKICQLIRESWSRLSDECISNSFSKIFAFCPEEHLDLEQIDVSPDVLNAQ
jgi:hypothetical protein